METRYRKSFVKQYRKLPLPVKRKVRERIELFRLHRFEPLLGNHPLQGERQGYWSINVTGDYRAICEVQDSIAYFVAVGTHSELYG